jgi:hypothetical protein
MRVALVFSSPFCAAFAGAMTSELKERGLIAEEELPGDRI